MTGFTPEDCSVQLGRDEIAGLAGTVATGMLSIFAVLFLLSLVARSAYQSYRAPPAEKWRIVKTPIDAYLLCLLFADLFQGIGAVMNLRWVLAGKTYCSTICTAQGAIRETGEAGVAMFTLAITIHTFFAIFFQWVPPRGPWVAAVVICTIWGYLLIFITSNLIKHPYAPGGPEPYYAPTPFYCWISKGFTAERIVGEYLWLWSCAILSIVLYVPLFFCLRGNIIVDPNNWTKISFRRLKTLSNDGATYIVGGSSAQKEARKMLVYPLAYTVIVLPMSIGRWMTYFNVETMSEANSSQDHTENRSLMLILVGACIFGLSGVINVTLFLLTRPKLLSLNQARRPKSLAAIVTIQRSISLDAYPAGSPSGDYKSIRFAPSRTPVDEDEILSKPASDPNTPDWIEFVRRHDVPERDPLGRLMLKSPQAI